MLESFTWLASWLTYDVFGIETGTKLGNSIHFFIEDTSKIFFLLTLIIFVMGLFRSILSPEKIRTYIEGKPKTVSYFLAVSLGAVTPFCSCSSVPLFIGFVEAGIPVGATMAFLIASPMINEVAVVILGTVIGWELTLIYIITGLLVGMFGGWATDYFKMDRYVEDYVWKIKTGQVIQPTYDTTLIGRILFAWGEVKEIVGRIWTYVFLGIAIGAALHGYVPTGFFAEYASADNWFAVPLAVVSGIPLYSNATGVIPVVEALLGKGVPIGTVIVLMMSVVAISIPEFVILRKVIRIQGLVYFASFLAIAFIFVGYLFNALAM
ncbi:MAG: permease [Methylocystaceae bacterium]|nr:permease [Methylocystaceae bacterium]